MFPRLKNRDVSGLAPEMSADIESELDQSPTHSQMGIMPPLCKRLQIFLRNEANGQLA